MRTIWFGLALLAVSSTSFADDAVPDAGDPAPDGGSERKEASKEANLGTDPFPEPEAEVIHAGALRADGATCRPTDELQMVVARLLEMADANHDDRVAKAEAQNLGTQLVNGFFARADANRNGAITPQEARETRTSLMAEQPAVTLLARLCRSPKTKKSFANVARLLDIEYGKPVTVNEARAAMRVALDEVFRLADKDRDGTLDATEASEASFAGTRALSHSVFQSADGNRDKGLSVDEFKATIDAPLRMAFHLADEDNDGKLAEPEAAAAVQELHRRLFLPASEPGPELSEK